MSDARASFDEFLSALLRWNASRDPPDFAQISAPLAGRLIEISEALSGAAAIEVLLVSEGGGAALVLVEPHDGSKPMMLCVPELTIDIRLH
jgi:hypothetical protein